MASRTTTYRAILIGLAILIVAFVVYFIYIGLNSFLHFSSSSSSTSTTTAKPVLNPVGVKQQIQENAPISNVPASGSSKYNVIPVGSGSGSGTNSGAGNGSGNRSGSNSGSGSSSNSGTNGSNGNGSGSGSNGNSGGNSAGGKNPCPDYLGDNTDCVQSNYTVYGPK